MAELHMAFRRLEERGEIRGGRFVDGFLANSSLFRGGESLRATRKLPPTGETIVLSAADPLNLVGSWSRRTRPGNLRQNCHFQ